MDEPREETKNTTTESEYEPSTIPPVGYDTKVKQLTRKDAKLAGVGGGVADYLGADPTLVRLLIVVAAISFFPVVPLLYVAAWIIVPESTDATHDVAPPPPPAPNGAPSPYQADDLASI